MKENMSAPWKKMVMASVISVLLMFFLTFGVTLLCNYHVVSLETGKKLMFLVVFLGSFLGEFIVTVSDKRILYTTITSIFTFILLNLLGLFMVHKFSTENTVYVLIILCVSAIINSIVNALIK